MHLSGHFISVCVCVFVCVCVCVCVVFVMCDLKHDMATIFQLL